MGKLGVAARLRLPASERASVVGWTVVLLVASLLVLVVATQFIINTFVDGFEGNGLVVAGALRTLVWGPVIFFLVLKHHQLKFANAQLQVSASTDFLTDCLNRQAFTTIADRQLAGLDGNGSRHALLIIDADDFKQVNDRFGHDQGDHALRVIAKAIKASVRTTDIVGRLGGEEFGALLVGADAPAAAYVAERIREAIGNAPFTPAGERQRLTVSIGGAIATEPTDFGPLNRRADQQMYRAKRFGRDRVLLEPSPEGFGSDVETALVSEAVELAATQGRQGRLTVVPISAAGR